MQRTPIPSNLMLALIAASFALFGTDALCLAGMPSPLFDDVETFLSLGEEPKQRVQVISFFLLAFFLSAAMVKCLWNGLRGEFQKLPYLHYGHSLLITFAWGLLFCIVLVMISGARELMTPGAWEKKGATYQLTDSEVSEASPSP